MVTPYLHFVCELLRASIACLSTTKLLGLYISDNFSWQAHADYMLESAVFLVSYLLKLVSKKELCVHGESRLLIFGYSIRHNILGQF
jgi:hypothetical protein